jgi:CBS domain-containing protein
MTRDVVTVGVDTPYKQVVQLLAESKVSGLPVVDPAGHVVGVVTEADLLAAVVAGTGCRGMAA